MKKVRRDKAAEKADFRARKEAIKTIPQLHREAQAQFNLWTRLRDAKQPCISCGAPPPNLDGLHAGRDAGHYRSIGSAAHLRYDPSNVNAQCVHCNQWGAGKAVEYRIGLIARLGLAEVERLESDNTVRKWARETLVQIRDEYKRKARELKEKAA